MLQRGCRGVRQASLAVPQHTYHGLAQHRLRPRRCPPACVSPANDSQPSTSGRDAYALEIPEALRLLKHKQTSAHDGPGRVFLIGTGPGDPGLLTLRAAHLMQTADVVLYDRLVSDEILAMVGPSARMVYVGKQAGFHTRTQSEIHDLMLQFAEAGATVIRLKGGDPYVFGRGGEEMQYLQQHGIQVACVPGITAASGICAELGIPMTHRGVATSVRFLTGHSREGGEQQLHETVAASADPHTTLVVYMGLQMLPTLVEQLTGSGLKPTTPAVAVERGTTADQRVTFGTVEDLPGNCKAAALKSPTLIVIGDVVALSPGWQEWSEQGRPAVWQPRCVHAWGGSSSSGSSGSGAGTQGPLLRSPGEATR